MKSLKFRVGFVLVLALVVGAGVWVKQANLRMPDVWSGSEVDREIHGYCEGGMVVDVHIDNDGDGVADLFAYYLIRPDMPAPKNGVKSLRPFIIQVANEPVDTDIQGDTFYLDYDLDGRVDVRTMFPSEELNPGSCTPAGRVRGASSRRGSPVRL